MASPLPPGSRLIVRKPKPLNAEPPLDILVSSFSTSEDTFFIRTHGEIPRLNVSEYSLRICGRIRHNLNLTIDDLRSNFESCYVQATLECAGNRREELDFIDEVEGTPWEQATIGTATWRGVRLADVLRKAGCDSGDLHIAFEGADKIEKEGETFKYGSSIPLAKAMSPEVILAYEMNGEPLSTEHGYPLRVVVPGYIGARSVKWIREISVQDAPSSNYFQQKAYKLVPDDMDEDNVDWHAGLMLGELPVNSVICIPEDEARISSGEVLITGYAISGGGRSIERVEISTDDGQNWIRAELGEQHQWTWTIWTVSLPMNPGDHTVTVRAWDSAAQTQPQRLEDVWNFKGYVNNAWHRILIEVR